MFSFLQNIKILKKHEKVCNDNNYCYVEVPNKDKKILKYNHGEKPLKAPVIFYANSSCLLEKKYAHVKIILKNLIQKKNNYAPSSYALFTNCSFDATKNKLDYYKSEEFA